MLKYIQIILSTYEYCIQTIFSNQIAVITKTVILQEKIVLIFLQKFILGRKCSNISNN